MRIFHPIFLLIIVSVSVCRYDFICGEGTNPGKELLAKGEEFLLCLHFLPFKTKLGFKVKVDEFTALKVHECKYPNLNNPSMGVIKKAFRWD